MIDLQDVPSARPVPDGRREADSAMLIDIARGNRGQPRSGRRGWIIAAASVTAVAACGTASAVIFLPGRPAAVHDSARCYTRPSTESGASFPGTTIAVATSSSISQPPDVAAQAISVCRALWRQGFLRPGAVGISRPASGARYPVPPVVACVLPSGQAAVFPGNRHTCAQLGLPPMRP